MRRYLEQSLGERLGPPGTIASKRSRDFILIVALQPVPDVVRSAAIMRTLVCYGEGQFPSTNTRHDKIRIRGEAGDLSAVCNEMLSQRAVPQPAAIAIHWKRSCAAAHKNIGERSAIAIPLVVDDCRDSRNPGLP